uniref:Uncharacterized protein n=1 Tax=Anopheles culicifacies TaxID=139723 RepID=A0A182MT57_9DIPT
MSESYLDKVHLQCAKRLVTTIVYPKVREYKGNGKQFTIYNKANCKSRKQEGSESLCFRHAPLGGNEVDLVMYTTGITGHRLRLSNIALLFLTAYLMLVLFLLLLKLTLTG